MDNQVNIILAVASAIAVCFSAFYAYSTKKMQSKVIANKDDLDRLNQLIGQLKTTRAIQDDSSSFSDEVFQAAFDFAHGQDHISILKQNPVLREILVKMDWEQPMEQTEEKIKSLEKCRDLLF